MDRRIKEKINKWENRISKERKMIEQIIKE